VIGTVIASAVTNEGLVRANNEDSYLVDTDAGIFIVADGMGGHAAGEVASSMAVQLVRKAWTASKVADLMRQFEREWNPNTQKALIAALREGVVGAHLAIVERAQNNPAERGMGTTFTGFVTVGAHAMFAHAGDSRAYLVRDKIAIQLSEDHTVVARLEAAGLPQDTGGGDPSKWQGVLTNALGVGGGARVAVFLVPLYSGDRFLLCSDGVSEYVAEPEVGEVMLTAPSPARAAQRYVDLALERGGRDNATAVVVKVVDAPEANVSLAQQQRDEAVLAASSFLGPLSRPQRLRALRVTTPRDLPKGRPLLPHVLGDRAAYIVLEGQVQLPDGTIVGPGALVYPEALLEGRLARDKACALSDVRLLVVRRDDFIELTEEDSELGLALFSALSTVVCT
jgi:PPM family protein phosphatase